MTLLPWSIEVTLAVVHGRLEGVLGVEVKGAIKVRAVDVLQEPAKHTEER